LVTYKNSFFYQYVKELS